MDPLSLSGPPIPRVFRFVRWSASAFLRPRTVVALTLAVLCFAGAGSEAVAQGECEPWQDGQDCSFFGGRQLHPWLPVRAWGLCSPVTVDIHQRSFREKVCSRCPDGTCESCFLPAIRANGIEGWNAAHRHFWHWDKLVEVPGPPYHIMVKMLTAREIRKRLPRERQGDWGPAFTEGLAHF